MRYFKTEKKAAPEPCKHEGLLAQILNQLKENPTVDHLDPA